MSEEWKRPPPKLVRGKRKFPRYFIYLLLGIFIGGVAGTWAIFSGTGIGRLIPIEFIMLVWLALVAFIAVAFALLWWVTG